MTALVDVLSRLQQHNDMTDIDERKKEEKEGKQGQSHKYMYHTPLHADSENLYSAVICMC